MNQFSKSLHHMVGIELQMIIPTLFFRRLKGRCHGNQFVAKLLPPLLLALIALAFRNGMKQHSETKWDNAVDMYD